MGRLKHFVGWAVIVLSSSCGRQAIAADQQPGPIDPADNTTRASTQGADVYLNDSFEAADALHEARKLTEKGNWLQAAELLQKTADESGDRLVRVGSGLYIGIRQHVNGIIAKWPAKGLNAYRSLFGQQAQAHLTLLRSLHDLPELLTFVERYYCTGVVGEMIDTVGQLAIESGELDLARQIYLRALEHHPDARTHAPSWQAAVSLIDAMQGDKPSNSVPATRRADPPLPDVSRNTRWMGKDRVLEEVVAEVREGFTAVRESASPLEWPIVGGNPERNRSCSTNVDELGLLWRSPFVAPAEIESSTGDVGGTTRSDGDDALALIVQPVLSGGLIVLQHHRSIVAVHRNTGEPAWRYQSTEHSEQVDYLEERAPGWDAVTVHKGRVYASLPGDAIRYFSYGSSRLPNELVCLELGTGRLIWRVDQRTFDDSFAEVHFDSTPIVRFGRLYILGRRRRSFGFEDCYLYSFRTSDGALEHRTHLGSASTGSFGSRPATKAAAAMHGDTIYVCTNLGTIAAVSTHTGAVRWLRLYERMREGDRQAGGRFTSDPAPWKFNPVIWSRGRVISLGTDAADVLVLSDRDGSVLQSIPVDEFGGVEVLLGVRDDLLCGAGKAVACYDLAANRLRWSHPWAEKEGVYGRGVWADDLLLIPTQNALTTWTVPGGQRSDVPWNEECGGGNLLAASDQLLVAGSDSLCSYVRKTAVLRMLHDRMDAAPSDPLPALELAEVTLRAGDADEAMAALDEADRRATQAGEPIDASMQQRIFKDILTFAAFFDRRSAPDPAVLSRLLALASRYAPDVAGHLRFRLRFAELFRRHDQPDRALALYHQILRDRSLRDLPVDPRSTPSRRASTLAQERIADLIAQHGRTLYDPYEAQAQRWLAGARASGDGKILDRIVWQFPNSRAAPRALTSQAELLAQSGRVREAVRRWTTAYQRYPHEVDRPALLKRIADAYESTGHGGRAYQWLTKAAREHPSVLIEHEGRRVGFLEYRQRLADARDRVVSVRPDLNPPLTRQFSRTLDGPITLLRPTFGDDPAHRWTPCYIHAPDGIHAIAPQTGVDLWDKPAKVRMAAELLINTTHEAVFATPYEVFALDPATGKRRWSQGQYPPHLQDEAADWENGTTFRAHALKGNRLISVREDGRMSCVAITTGEVLWSATHKPAPWGKIALGNSWIAYHAVQDGRAVLCRIDLATGTWLDAILTDQTRPVENLFVTLDEQLIMVTSQSISSYDPESRARRWHTPVAGHVHQASVLVDVEAIYFSPDGRELAKIGVEDGRQKWLTENLNEHREGDLWVRREGEYLLVTTQASVAAIDPVTGLLLWRGTTPPQPRYLARFVTPGYVVAVDLSGEIHEGSNTAYFYDYRNASGRIPKGGACDLGPLEDVRRILAADGALLIQTGSTIRGWATE
ncbi:MAG: PQQ-binding-like beta-propeller repeat protein [Planctomycetes bacterium]|nr:PQQ-binding-like beta-propeller repeat protein [Planctomycetota bacterium]